MEIDNIKRGQKVFDAVSWSDYHEEREYLFIGGLQSFHLSKLHDVALQMEYSTFLEPMDIFREMISGAHHRQKKITKMNVHILRRMMTNVSYDFVVDSCPFYVQTLFTNFCHNVSVMEINMSAFNAKRPHKGYYPLKHMFFTDCGTTRESIQLRLFLQLFDRKLTSILIYRQNKSKFQPSIRLNRSFTISLLSGCTMIAADPELKSKFKAIVVLNPKNGINAFIEDQRNTFKQKGWRLEKKPYEHCRRGLCANALHVSPLRL